ncbi:copper amine oxidase N-terminal domain-containing protein [Neobacillus mesonae]|uniref:copper amine oxidase N-terminal domain-containing protein n=1 Tax=Neobacillus mesonae TaxID=1193713 RepID=UPI00203B808B|nr:copper amine oxidase N-terminal domain-containing protein [Neobacillus mesonae]MCM3571329.1 copper amine oxidase N-terminal domain-containing protein [Neobacillus mesonae]
MKMSKKWLSSFVLLVMLLSTGTSVIADDHDDDDDEKQEYYFKNHEDDDHKSDDEGGWEEQRNIQLSQQPDYWNIWSREPVNNPDTSLPIEAPGELMVFIGNQEKMIYFIPKDGQLLVSGEAIAKVLGAEFIFYPTSKICQLTKGDLELIVRAGSNAVYENKIKTPMPTQAEAYENSIYLPLSAAANALGYRVTWNEAKKAIVLQSL